MQFTELVGLVSALKASVAWAGEIREIGPEVLFRIFLLTRRLEKSAKARKEEVRDRLLAFVEVNGTDDEAGSRHFQFEEGKASRTRKRASAPKPELVEALFASKGLLPGRILQEKVTTTKVVDVSAMEQLVRLGQITQSELEACYEVSFSFNATEIRGVKKLMEGL